MSRRIVALTATVLFFLISTSAFSAGRKKRERPPQKPANITESRIQIVPKFTGGLLTGEIGDMVSGLSDGDADRSVAGFSLGMERYLNPKSAVGINLEVVWWYALADEGWPFRNTSYSASWMYRPSPTARTSIYVRPEIGFVSMRFSYRGARLGLDTHPFVRLGVGLFRYTSSSTNTRLELYFKNIFCEGHEYDPDDEPLGWNVQYIGLDLGIGIPIW